MSNHRYSPEFKDEAVRQIIEAGHSVTDVSARSGVSANSLHKWVKAVRPAAGALIGEVTGGDAGESAAIGAAAGAVASRRRGRAANQQAEQQAKQAAEAAHQATAEQVGNFKKAFGVCLEAKDYMVKS